MRFFEVVSVHSNDGADVWYAIPKHELIGTLGQDGDQQPLADSRKDVPKM
jgi:hypothetical protein